MYSFSYHVPIQTLSWIFESRFTISEKSYLYKIVSKSISLCKYGSIFLMCLFSTLYSAKDKHYNAMNDSLKRELKAERRKKLRCELSSSQVYVDSLVATNNNTIISEDNHQEYYIQNIVYGSTETIPTLNKIEHETTENWWSRITYYWELVITTWGKITGFFSLIVSLFVYYRWFRKFKRDPVKHTARTIKIHSPPIYYRWFRRKGLKFYNFLL